MIDNNCVIYIGLEYSLISIIIINFNTLVHIFYVHSANNMLYIVYNTVMKFRLHYFNIFLISKKCLSDYIETYQI